jgi:hypothetical protein
VSPMGRSCGSSTFGPFASVVPVGHQHSVGSLADVFEELLSHWSAICEEEATEARTLRRMDPPLFKLSCKVQRQGCNTIKIQRTVCIIIQ